MPLHTTKRRRIVSKQILMKTNPYNGPVSQCIPHTSNVSRNEELYLGSLVLPHIPTLLMLLLLHQVSGHSALRRTFTQVPSEEKKRTRSSSVAGTPSNRNSVPEHVPVKRLVQATTAAAGRPSRSPTKARPQEETPVSSKLDVTSDKSSFLLLGQEEYNEHRAVVTHAVFNPSGTLVASADIDGVVKLWSPSPSPRLIAAPPDPSPPPPRFEKAPFARSGLPPISWGAGIQVSPLNCDPLDLLNE
ncbi:WD repeat-containing protein 91 [Portunus trituberculatus]|uniref:WD repeat-containing protein 91 n=1 Tax=Portunus trituberculatus TaxID=210409 RepID=A0A5B7CY38_PORTR|nr:WD repeat-containing protein 91 [Portunus trituberculatus]